MIIGIVGSMGAGKGTVTNYFVRKGFKSVCLSDFLREEIKKRGLVPDRRTLQDVGNELREEYGPDILMRMALKQAKGDFVIESIRNPHEVWLLKQTTGAMLIGVDAHPETRFSRLKAREKETGRPAVVDFDEFQELEKRERSVKPHELQVQTVLKMADHTIMNDYPTKAELIRALDKKMAPLISAKSDDLVLARKP